MIQIRQKAVYNNGEGWNGITYTTQYNRIQYKAIQHNTI